MSDNCCPAMDLQWSQRQAGGQYQDVYYCVSCGHVHREESYLLPLRFPYNNHCVTCGGDQQLVGPGEIRCTQCGTSDDEDRAIHDKYASLHPERDYIKAARALKEAGRYVLALKLATAAVKWGTNAAEAMVLRNQILEALNLYDQALDEAYEWVERQAGPPLVWGLIANLEAAIGNLQGAMTALEKGLKLEGDKHPEWWCDYAEIKLHVEDRQGAVQAAAHAVRSDKVRDRAVVVLVEVGERFYAGGQFAQALGACSVAGDHQEKYESLAWLRARIAAANNDTKYLVHWLEVTLALNPQHKDADDMLTPYKKPKGWFGWG
jgi:tetratricopeptide (TPR) repeat protein